MSDDVMIAVDPHKASNTAAVLDPVPETVIESARFANTLDGYAQLTAFAGRWSQRRWAVEGCLGRAGRWPSGWSLMASWCWMCQRSWLPGCGCIRVGHGRPVRDQVGTDGPFQAGHLGASQAAPAAVEPGLGDGMQVRHVGVTLGVLGQARLGAQRDLRVLRSRGSGDQGSRDRAQADDHRVHRQDHKRVRARLADVGVPHLAPQRPHRYYSGHSAAVTSDTGADLPA